MIPFAIATGKIAYASWVNGSWRMKNNGGGMTSLKLEKCIKKLNRSAPSNRFKRNIPIHGKVMVNSMCCEMKHEK